MKKSRLAVIYRKDEKTIANWIQRYDETGNYQRRSIPANRTFSKAEKEWIIAFYHVNPLSFLDEAKSAFTKPFHRTISISHVWTIIHDYGMTWKVLERRAIQIKDQDVCRFVNEMDSICWSQRNIIFLDEISFDNRGMLRKRGYSMKGTTAVCRGEFSRKPRVSLLCFLGADGILDYYDVEETFDRSSFARYCTVFAHSGHVQMYPGKNSVWILDRAKIHCDPDIILYLRQIGIVPFFLPAYSPFFNQIEYLFGYLKKAFQRHYAECRIERNVIYFVVKIMEKFKRFNMAKVFEHCGWLTTGRFDPCKGLGHGVVRLANVSLNAKDLGFQEREEEE
ncbi:hypothetical protein Ae201684P_018597 [Aphanomyces euteiches]|uniref:Tc1-like transposase DDE domain-containing protein n=1 Tax=Aphanomyces euteiches TaxID=100861 RepID=A0A6G0XUK5_9STRA|nr:hypothetical protein Ae201684_000828 [Aphanomyces euteiches]KAH9099584.1 hypothetical protein Ae201684P_018597 [Aphanomyces euteiches]